MLPQARTKRGNFGIFFLAKHCETWLGNVVFWKVKVVTGCTFFLAYNGWCLGFFIQNPIQLQSLPTTSSSHCFILLFLCFQGRWGWGWTQREQQHPFEQMLHPQGIAPPPQYWLRFRGMGMKGRCSESHQLLCHQSATSCRLHTTPASSSWEQLCVPTSAWAHSSSVSSCPEHWTSSRRMRRELPSPNSAFLLARTT